MSFCIAFRIVEETILKYTLSYVLFDVSCSDRIDGRPLELDSSYNPMYTGAGVYVYVIDVSLISSLLSFVQQSHQSSCLTDFWFVRLNRLAFWQHTLNSKEEFSLEKMSLLIAMESMETGTGRMWLQPWLARRMVLRSKQALSQSKSLIRLEAVPLLVS